MAKDLLFGSPAKDLLFGSPDHCGIFERVAQHSLASSTIAFTIALPHPERVWNGPMLVCDKLNASPRTPRSDDTEFDQRERLVCSPWSDTARYSLLPAHHSVRPKEI